MNRTATAITAAVLAVAGMLAAAQPAAASHHYTILTTGDGPYQHVRWNVRTGWDGQVFYGIAYAADVQAVVRGKRYRMFWRFYDSSGRVLCGTGSYEQPERHENLQNGASPGHTCGNRGVRRVRIGIDVSYDGDGWREVSVAESTA